MRIKVFQQKEWVIFSKLENFNSLLNYNINDFTPSGNLFYINEHGEILHQTPMKGLFNLRWYIQHLIDEYGSEDEAQNPLSHENWIKHTNWKFIKHENLKRSSHITRQIQNQDQSRCLSRI